MGMDLYNDGIAFEKHRGEKAVALLKEVLELCAMDDAVDSLAVISRMAAIREKASSILYSDLMGGYKPPQVTSCKCPNRLLPDPCICFCCRYGCNRTCENPTKVIG